MTRPQKTYYKTITSSGANSMKGMMVPLLMLLMTGIVFGQQEPLNNDLPGRLVLQLGDADLEMLRNNPQGLQAAIPDARTGQANRVQLRYKSFQQADEQDNPSVHVWWLTGNDIYSLQQARNNLTDDLPEEKKGKIVQIMLEYDPTPPPPREPRRDIQRDTTPNRDGGGAFGGTSGDRSIAGNANDRFNIESERNGGIRTDTTIANLNFRDENAPRRATDPIWPDRTRNDSVAGTRSDSLPPRITVPPRTQQSGTFNPGGIRSTPTRDLNEPNRSTAFANDRLELETERTLYEREAQRLADAKRAQKEIDDERARIRIAREDMARERRFLEQQTYAPDRLASADTNWPPVGNRSIAPAPTNFEQFQIKEYDPTPMPRRERLAQTPVPTTPTGSIRDTSLTIPGPQGTQQPTYQQVAQTNAPTGSGQNRGSQNPMDIARAQLANIKSQFTPAQRAELGLHSGLLGDTEQEAQQRERSWALLFTMLLASLGLNIYLAWISRGFYVRYHELADELRETFTATM